MVWYFKPQKQHSQHFWHHQQFNTMLDIIATKTTMDAPVLGDSTQRVLAPRLPLMKRIKYSILAFLWYRVLLKGMLYYSEAKKYFVSPGEREPDLVKAYPVRKSLAIRSVRPPLPFHLPTPIHPSTTASSSRPRTTPPPPPPNSPPSSPSTAAASP